VDVPVSTDVLLIVGLAGILLAGSVLVYVQLVDEMGPVRIAWKRYVHALDRELVFQRASRRPVALALTQVFGVVGLLAGSVLLEEPLLVAVAGGLAVLPWMVLQQRHRKRIEHIEQQLDGWLLILANSVRVTPALAEALRSSAELIGPPISQELEQLEKEVRLGTPVDEAVLNMSRRIDSRMVSGALAALLVARQTGGDLAPVLERTAGALREMNRLEGVLRAKTAEGRQQAYVLSAIPFVLLGAIHWIDPEWLGPLTTTTLGLVVSGVATALWLAALFSARWILDVNL
jgi:tight adherence protein B